MKDYSITILVKAMVSCTVEAESLESAIQRGEEKLNKNPIPFIGYHYENIQTEIVGVNDETVTINDEELG